jgi:putrescine aminotransferase
VGYHPAVSGPFAAEEIRKAIASPPQEIRRAHADHVNRVFVDAMDTFGCGRDFVRAHGCTLWDAAGRDYVDFLAGYGSTPLGHNHPEVRAAVEEVLRSALPHFTLVSPQPLATALASRLVALAPGDLSVCFLASSGSEAVEGSLKLARLATRRPRFVSAERSYHGTTLGALSVTGSRRHRDPFSPLLPGCAVVPWGDADAIERQLRSRDVAAVILEPIQAEGGIRLPPPGWLAQVKRLCDRFGTMLIFDEVQTGLGRCGRMFACEEEGVEPDVLLLAKALSGGVAPISAMLTRRRLWERAYGTWQRFDLHCSTFSGGPIACAAALATIEIIKRQHLDEGAAALGTHLGEVLRAATAGHPLVRDVRGRGLLWGIELATPADGVTADLVGQWVVSGLLDQGVLSQVCSDARAVVRAEPPLVISRDEIDRLGRALRTTLSEHARGKWRAVAGAAARALRGSLRKQPPVSALGSR